MLSSPFILALALSATATATVVPRQSNNSTSETPVSVAEDGIVDATYDGKCFYPKSTPSFDLESYLGRWYQLAGTRAPFTSGCSCIYADYALNENGTVSVTNGCKLPTQAITIQGLASSAPAGYGEVGVFNVRLNGTPEPACPGPNYIVQEFDDDFAIVQAASFSTLFLLGRRQVVDEAVIDQWLERAGKLGANLTEVIRVNQTSCGLV